MAGALAYRPPQRRPASSCPNRRSLPGPAQPRRALRRRQTLRRRSSWRRAPRTGALRGASPAPDETSTTLAIAHHAQDRPVRRRAQRPGPVVARLIRPCAAGPAATPPGRPTCSASGSRSPASRQSAADCLASRAQTTPPSPAPGICPAARLAIRYRPAMSVYAVPTLPDAAETASTSAPICATPWMSRTTPLTVAAEAATIIPGASESVRAPSANPNRIQQRCTVRITLCVAGLLLKCGPQSTGPSGRSAPAIRSSQYHPRNRFAVMLRASVLKSASAERSSTAALRPHFHANPIISSRKTLPTPPSAAWSLHRSP